jgi:hypothetical protein
MEFSFVPAEPAAKDKHGAGSKSKKEGKNVDKHGQFAAGLQKGVVSFGDGDSSEATGAKLEGERAEGRQKMRKVARSASKKVMRNL